MRKNLFFNKNLQIIFGVTLTAVMGVASITPAFPKIEKQFGISAQDVGLLITIFTLPGVILTPVLGVLADRMGRKKVLIPALLLFGTAGFLCTFAKSFHLLLVLRLFQGIGAASLGSLNATLIGDFFEGKERAAAMGYNASVLSVGTASYPAIGGALATIAWFYPFLLPLFAVPIAFIVLFSLEKSGPANKNKLGDYLRTAWKSIKDVQIIGIFIASIFTFIILYGAYLSYFPFLLDYNFHAGSLIIGLLMSTASMATAITSFRIGKLTQKYSERTLLKTAFIIYAVSMIIIPLIPNLWLLIIPLVLFGIAQGLNIPSLLTLLSNLAPVEHRAAFMSINGTVLRLGQTLGPLIMGLIYGFWDIPGVYYTGAFFALMMFVLVLIMIKGKSE